MSISQKLHETFNFVRYSGVPLNEDVCPYTLRVYPSKEFESLYTSSDAIIFSISVALIFAFVTLVFIFYDAKVERRQRVVLTSAEKTDAIVSSLFPSTIKDQMLQQDMRQSKLNSLTNSLQYHPIDTTKAMATLYPETTIIFADLAGFTAWSRCVA
jgi:predicted membrane protein